MGGHSVPIAQIGAGEKPKSIPDRPPDEVKRPTGLSDEERDIWRLWASAASAKRTLTKQTAHGFRLLVEFEAERRAMRAQIDREGWTFEGPKGQAPHPLLPAYGRLQKQVEGLCARFGLLPFGKAEPELPKATKANPWADISR